MTKLDVWTSFRTLWNLFLLRLQFDFFSQPLRYLLFSVFLTAGFSALIGVFWETAFHWRPNGVRWLLDFYDVETSYIINGSWMVNGSIPFVDTKPEYPLLPHFIFGPVAWIAHQLAFFPTPIENFVFWWATLNFFVWTWLLRTVFLRISPKACLLFLTPGAFYFTLNRYDMYPAFAMLLGFLSLKDKRYGWGSFWIGVCAALKGYGLFTFPALMAFFWLELGPKQAIYYMLIAAAPFVGEHFIVWAYAGMPGLRSPYLVHTGRGMNGESTYNALAYVLQHFITYPKADRFVHHLFGRQIVGSIFQICFALWAAWMRPKTLEQLVHASLVCVLAFISLLIFHSPQWLYWSLPLLAMSGSPFLFWLGITYGFTSYWFFPWAVDGGYLWQAAVVTLAIHRIVIIVYSAKQLRKGVRQSTIVLPGQGARLQPDPAR